MAKVFRLFDDIDVQHWENTNSIGPAQIKTIGDVSGGIMSKDPTSIPSPFARMDLAKSAFKNVVDLKTLDGQTVFNKIVSDNFDLMELLFHSNEIEGINISSWDAKQSVDLLVESINKKHRLLGKTLKLFIQQDKIFEGNSKIFIFSRKHKILGGTSPLSVVFTTGNSLKDTNIRLSNRALFTAPYQPLYKRDVDFQKYVYSLIYNNSGFGDKFSELKEYLDHSLRTLENEKPKLYTDLQDIKLDDNYYANNYAELNGSIDGDIVTLFNIPLRKSKGIEVESDFFIKTDLPQKDKIPLVLQNEYTLPINYFGGTRWTENKITIPYSDGRALHERTLPGLIKKYPYKTVDDFLESVIFRLPYKLDSSKFLALSDGENQTFLLPLKSAFFKYFTTDDLINKQVGGKPMLTAEILANSVTVQLRIPIKKDGHYITLSRKYKVDGEIDLSRNVGIVKNMFVNIGISPFVQMENSDASDHYRVGLFSVINQGIDLSFTFQGKISSSEDSYARTSEVFYSSKYFVLNKKFDTLRVEYDGSVGLLIPKLVKKTEGPKNFTFGVDFGTTNTHIEYKNDNGRPTPFSIDLQDLQTVYTISDVPDSNIEITRLKELKKLSEYEYIPELLKTDLNTFPIRTVISNSSKLKVAEVKHSMSQMNIPFNYILEDSLESNVYTPDLKWGNQDIDALHVDKIRLFIDELFFLMRNKVLSSNGNLSLTKIHWSYPLSMSIKQISDLENFYINLYQKYFSKSDASINVKKYNESISPFEYLKNEGGLVSFQRPVALIDIGGGTTDIAIYKNNKAEKLTSFRFGANKIYSNSNSGINSNGFVKEIEQFSESNELSQIFSNRQSKFLESNQLTEAMWLAFSADTNIRYKDSVSNKFSDQLFSNENIKAVYVFYYSAIVYHLATFMKANDYDIPEKLIFSGNGSKILNIIDKSEKALILNKVSVFIFEKIYESDAPNTFSVEKRDNPKEMTAKGLTYAKNFGQDINEMKATLLGKLDKTLLKHNSAITYEELSEEDAKSVNAEVNNFIDLFVEMYRSLNKEYFDIDASLINGFKEILSANTLNYIMKGIDENKGSDLKVTDSLFFYPLENSLYQFVRYVNK
ncbi:MULTISPECIES: cell division protein FtsA [unclassified Kaistella]|uniref:cell division protein FtsA n=1 Tax=unclassified Kaistella TaxID=2762626 RepID=UPI002733389D|nr:MULTISPECIES: cell division protein FtsA [unclassified Kaistella]MDP2455142.1 cell division FtsA domain-containing protein [Kaistella sp. SH11-4b]MDP2458049.1 cell division FtsA domain-containing protein [Kaistella sp. SH40-3]MDP2461016.1 cell division FtsA domain-containing protein [Kaistella sp. SH19-2b]